MNAIQAQLNASETVRAPTLLFVDDEPNILSSLRRLFRPHGYTILTADSGAAGLALLAGQEIDLVISDMRMPTMDGAQFLEQVRSRWPDTVRMLLTGYSDIDSIMAAINRGEIYRYLTKPWDDNDIVLQVRHAIERRNLEREKERLEALARRQNEELKALNAGLEAKVEERTQEVRRAHDQLVTANDKLKTTFITSIKVFSNLIDLRSGHLSGHSRRVADIARKIAVKMGLGDAEVQEVFIAGLLLDIGKLGFSDDMLTKPVSMLNNENLALFRKHPVRAESLMMPLEDLRGAAKMLGAQLERHDGLGFPEHLKGEAIAVGARILALASDFDNLQLGMLMPRALRREEAIAMVLENSGKRYDPAVVDAFRAVLGLEARREAIRERKLSSAMLEAGMKLSRDLLSAEGFLLLSAEHVINERMITQIRSFERKNDSRLTIYAYEPPQAVSAGGQS
jgi:response regulator RpfG family c-di-GMP phosphodiesterase